MAIMTFAQSRVTVTVNTGVSGIDIPSRFIGLSFETGDENAGYKGTKGFMFSPGNTELITLFKDLGVKNIRMGGNSVDKLNDNPSHKGIDELFAFAKAAGVKVIYSVRLRDGNPWQDASIARYIWTHYRKYVDCFTIGNEPDWHYYHIHNPYIHQTNPNALGSAFPSYFSTWKHFATVIADSAHGARFAGPDAGSNYPVPGSKNTFYRGKSWTLNFAIDASKWHMPHSCSLAFVTQHNYVGQNARRQKLTPAEMVKRMLSPTWDNSYYPDLYKVAGTPVLPKGVRYRLTESNSFSDGVKNGSDCFATALYSLDYMYWWAEHHCLGVNYHTNEWKYNTTIVLDSEGNYQIRPMGYGIMAFNLGGHGEIVPVKLSKSSDINMTVYAVRNGRYLYVTLINKTYGALGRKVSASIRTSTAVRSAKVIYLISPGHSAFATSGITLGGAPIRDKGTWKGKWTSLKWTGNGPHQVSVPPTSAAIVKIDIQ